MIRNNEKIEFHIQFCADEYDNHWDSPWLWLWVVSSIINSIYSYTWDIKMDWGLLDSNAGENRFLREEVVYSSTVSVLRYQYLGCIFR